MIRFVMAICHDPHQELPFVFVDLFVFLFLKISERSSFFPPSGFCLLFCTFASFSMTFANWHVCVTHAETRRRCERSPVAVLPEGLSFIQLRKSHWTRA